MKVIPKRIYSDQLNPEDFDGLHLDYILPKDKYERYWEELRIRRDELFYDNLYDDDVEYDAFEDNKVRKFTEKIPLTEYDLLTEEEKIGYHVFLQDYKADQKSESST